MACVCSHLTAEYHNPSPSTTNAYLYSCYRLDGSFPIMQYRLGSTGSTAAFKMVMRIDMD